MRRKRSESGRPGTARNSWYAMFVVGLAALVAVGAFGGTLVPATAIDVHTRWSFDLETAHPGDRVVAALEVTLPNGFHVHSDRPLDELLIPTVLTVSADDGVTVREIAYPEPVLVETEFSDDPLAVFETRFVIGVALEISESTLPGTYGIHAEFGYQACDDKTCLAPKTREIDSSLTVVPLSTERTRAENPIFDAIVFSGEPVAEPPANPRSMPDPVAPIVDCDVVAELQGFTVLGTAGGYLDEEDFLAFLDAAETGTVKRNLLEGKGPIAIVLLVLLGGIALNLTPCVLPLIPINLGIIGAGAQAQSRGRGFLLGGTYGLAMAVVYGVLGLVVILTAGTFGSINSTIWFNVAIAILFVVLGLAMFDLVHIDFSKYQGKIDVSKARGRGTVALAFGMGAVTALLAGACIAPVVIQVIVYSSDQYARGSEVALALPFFLGLGMALPWPFAGAGLSFLPRPGRWMVRVKQGMGLLILVFAVYYGYLAWEIFDSTRVDGDLVREASNAHLEEGWTDSICEGLATARAEDKLVLVDMWATWCKNCLAMDKSTFRDEAVTARLADYVKVKFQAEDLDAEPARDLIEHFEGIGLPTYGVLRPGAAPN